MFVIFLTLIDGFGGNCTFVFSNVDYMFLIYLRHVVKTPTLLHMLGLCLGVCGLLGHHATGWLGPLRPGAVWDLMHPGLVARSSLGVGPKLRVGHPVLLLPPPSGHHRVLLRHDHF